MMHRIGRYEIQAELGRGGFGQVYRAFDPTVSRLVAIKTLTADGDPELLKRFRNEAAAAGKLRHNNIVTIYDFGDHEGAPYLVMELLDGEDLERIITSGRPLTLLQKLDIISQSASGLHHAHAKGIVHRDVKPANIMLQNDGVVKIMDFGIALLTQATAARITPKGSMLGTFPYMAPEQFYGSASDALTDIFAFGVTCFKLLTGTHPFEAEEMGAMMFNIMNKAPQPIRSLNPECPEALEQAVFKMLAKERELRYQSLEDVRFDVGPVILDLRKERVNDLLSEARDHIASNRLDAAQAAIREVLADDPANRTARDLRDTLNRQIRENEVRPRVAALVAAGRGHLEARRFEDAIKSFESALQVDKSNVELQQLIADARAAWDRAQRAGRLLEDAQHSLARGDLTAARHRVHEALSLEPQNPQAGELCGTIEDRVSARERERQLEDGLTHARRLILVESFDEAINRLQELSAEFPDSSAARELLARARYEVENQQRRQRLQAAVNEAKRLLKSGNFEEAVDKLAASRAEFPESAELRDLAVFAAEELQAQKQSLAIAKASAGAQSLLAAQKYDSALELLQGVIAEYPAANALREIVQTVMSAKAEYERRTTLADAVASAEALLKGQRFREAAERIAAFVRAFGDTAELEPLRRQAEEGLEKQRRLRAVQKLLLDAHTLLDENRPDDATRVLQSATIQYPDEPELARLLVHAQERVREEQQAEAISRLIAEAESLARARQFDRALQVLDQGLEEYAGAERLQRCREATLAGQARYRRDQKQREAINRIRALRQNGQFAEALEAIDSALHDFGDDSGLLELRRQIAIDQVAHEHSADIHNTLQRAQGLLDRGEAASAVQVLEAAIARFPGDETLARLKQVAQTRLDDIKREEDIAGILRNARAQFEASDLDGALGTLNDAVRRYGENPGLIRARDGVIAAKTARERQQALDEVIQDIRGLYTSGRSDEALDRLTSAIASFGEEPELLQWRTQMAADRERRRAIAATVREAEHLARAGKFPEALNTIEIGLKQYPGSDELIRLRDSIQNARLRWLALTEARRLHAEGQLESALGVISHALETAPGDPELLEWKARIESDQERRVRSERVERALQEGSSLLASGRPDAAVALLRPAAAEYPDDVRISRLLRSAQDELQRAERERDIASVKAQAQSLLAQQKYAEAIALLDARFPGEPQLDSIRTDAQARLQSERERSAIEAARAQLLTIEARIASTRKSRLSAAAAEARQVAAKHAGNVELETIASRIERQVNAILSAPQPPRRPLPWKAIGTASGAAAAVIMAFAIAQRWSRPSEVKRPEPSTFAVDIRTDPPGAAVSVAGRSCTPPGCQFNLPTGQYTVRAQMKGYKAAEQTLVVRAQNPPGITNITLAPEPSAPPPAGLQTGTLMVRASVADARVLVDNVPRGLTDSSGRFRTDIAPGSHTLRVEKTGYRTTPEQRVAIAAGRTRELDVPLMANPAPPEIRNAPARVQVRAGEPVAPPRQQVTTPSKQESEWERVRNASDPDQLEAFIRDYRNSPHAEEAQARLAEVLWARTKQSDLRALQAYVARLPRSPHTAEAQRLIDDLTWNVVNKNSAESLQAFIDQNGSSRHRADAQALIERLNREREAAEARGKAAAQEREAIRAALQRFNQAFIHKNARELRQIWPGAPSDWTEAMNQRGAYFIATLSPAGEPDVTGTRATIRCDLSTQTIIRGQPQPLNRKTVRVSLRKVGDQWVIEDPRGAD